jgi:hypothetical protein
MREQKYCKSCGIALSEGLLGFFPQYYKFEDGDYCQKCAKIRVEKARGNCK